MFLRVIGGILALFALGTIPLGIHTVSEGASVLPNQASIPQHATTPSPQGMSECTGEAEPC